MEAALNATRQEDEFSSATLELYRKAVRLLEEALSAIKREWDALTKRIDNVLKRAIDELNDSVWATISEWFTDTVTNSIERIRELTQQIATETGKLIETVARTLDESIPVGALIDVAFNYSTSIRRQLSSLPGEMTPTGEVNHWEGPTATTFKERTLEQIAATNNVNNKVAATSTWLIDVAKSNTAYMVLLGERVTTVTRDFVAAALDATATASGILTQSVFTLEALSETVATAVKEVQDYLMNLANRLVEVLEKINTLALTHNDETGLIRGQWPPAVRS